MNETAFFPRLTAWAILAVSAAAAGAADDRPIPPFVEIEQVVLDYFQRQPDYLPGDLITRDQVEPLLKRLAEMGLPLPDRKEILAAVPGEGEFIVKQLSTPAGRKFMRRIARYPEAFDRLDRLGRLPRGRSIVPELIRGPDGYKMIEYMTTAAGGVELGKQLSNSPGGKDFNAPTGRLYTADILLDRLERSRSASVKAAGKSRP